MSNFAIKGHSTRGKEIIEILQMFGGINKYDITYTEDNLWYCLRYKDNVIIATYPNSSIKTVLSIEEFLEKFPYKVGDKVIVSETQKVVTIEHMSWRDDKLVYETCYNEDCVAYYTTNDLQPYKEETMERKYNVEEYLKVWEETENGLEVVVNDNFELKEDGGKFYIIKKRPQYPKTYEECCKVLGCKADDFFTEFGCNGDDVEISDYEDKLDDLLQNFRKLIYYRDAYWKIAGEQVGLGKSWEPDWNNLSTTHEFIKINKGCFTYSSRVLVFPNVEMRDAFYENFKELIESCNELL